MYFHRYIFKKVQEFKRKLSAIAQIPSFKVVTQVDFNTVFFVPLESTVDGHYLFSFSGLWTSRYTVKWRRMKRRTSTRTNIP
jgi:predicted Abi (CAAX) family protease